MPTWLKGNSLEDDEIEVRDENDTHLGDLTFAHDHVLWCRGRTHHGNGIRISYEDFAELLSNYSSD